MSSCKQIGAMRMPGVDGFDKQSDRKEVREEEREVREEEREVREEDYRQLANKMRDLLRRKTKRELRRTPDETSSEFDKRALRLATALISEYDWESFKDWDSDERRERMKSLKEYYNREYSSLPLMHKIGAFIGAGAGKKKKPKGSKKKGQSNKGHSKKGSKGSNKKAKKATRQGGGKSRKPKKAKQTRKRPKKSRSRRPKKMKRSKRAGAGDNPYPLMFSRNYAYDTYVK